MAYEFATLSIYPQNTPCSALLYNYRTHEPLQDFEGAGYPDILQAVSAEGWRVVYTYDNIDGWIPNSNISRWCIWLQREVTGD